MTGMSLTKINKLIKSFGDNQLKEYLWKYEGELLLLDPEGVPILLGLKQLNLKEAKHIDLTDVYLVEIGSDR